MGYRSKVTSVAAVVGLCVVVLASLAMAQPQTIPE